MTQDWKNHSHLRDLPKQIQDIHDAISTNFKYNASFGILKFLQRKNNEEVARLEKSIEENVILKLNDVLSRLHDEETSKSERNGLMKEYFRLIHPKTFVSHLNTGLDVTELKKEYHTFHTSMTENSSFPSLFTRYKAANEIFNIYQGLLYEKTKDTLRNLQLHAEQMNSHFVLLEDLGKKRGDKQLFQLGAGLLGSFAAGPLGGLVSRNIIKSFSNDEAYINHSLNEVSKSWNKVINAYRKLLQELRDCYEAINSSLYGGFLLKVQEDLKSLGYEIRYFDAFKGSLSIGVIDSEEKRIKSWMEDNRQALAFALQQENFLIGDQLLTGLQQYLAANEAINSMEIDGYTVKELVQQMRYNFLVHYIELNFWKERKYEESLRYYLKLLKEIPQVNVDNETFVEGLTIPKLHTIFLRMIHCSEQIKSTKANEIYKAFFHYYQLNKNNQSLSIQIAKNYELFKNLVKIEEKIENNVQEKCYDEMIQAYSTLLSDQDLKKDSFLNYLVRQRRIKKLKLDPIATLYQRYREKSYKHFYLRFRYALPILLLLFISWNGMTFAYAGKLAPGIDSIYFNHIENKWVNSNIENSSLKKALDRQDYKRVKFLLSIGADINMEGSNGKTVLANAIEDDQSLTFIEELLIMYNANPNVISDNRPLLFTAIDLESEELVETLIQFGADSTLTSEEGMNAIDYVLIQPYENIHTRIMPLLLQGASVKNDFQLRSEYLLWSIITEDVTNLELMLQMNGDANGTVSGRPLLFHAIERGALFPLVETLLTHHADPNIPSDQGENLLSYTMLQDIDVYHTIQLLLDYGADANGPDFNGSTPIMFAGIHGTTSLVSLLLSEGADPDIVDKNGKTAVMYAAERGSDSVFGKLLSVSNMNRDLLENWLIDSVSSRNQVRTKALLSENVDPNTIDINGNQALLLAVMNQDYGIVQSLITAGADPNAMNRDLVTPLEYARDHRFTDIVELLMNYGGNFKAVALNQLIGYWVRDHDEAVVVRISHSENGTLYESMLENRTQTYLIGNDLEMIFQGESRGGQTQHIRYDRQSDTFYNLSGTYRRYSEEEYDQHIQLQQEVSDEKVAQQEMLLNMIGLWEPIDFIEDRSYIHITQFQSSPIILRTDIHRIHSGSYMVRISESSAEINGNEISGLQGGRKYRIIDQDTIQYAEKDTEYITLKRVTE
ncbi:ankyrin repeat domain-containing protein [Evansella sp. AB-P1]|uniref:ankyrin repeat domain-containing protein n=1 Tax=Evansella sp. AB-P1 TaxID=3037653 RepID=UPI00241DDEBB|nr:ankyrin repeat domain-containing protein [Evansella sp. AB-P1]MDG5787074.1 ankyrin repeat domain-containing protein [Evansella sp. AB-P1]